MERRVIVGFLLELFGFLLMLIPLFILEKEGFFSWIYGLPIFIVGLIIMFNKKEDEIEKIKYKGGKK